MIGRSKRRATMTIGNQHHVKSMKMVHARHIIHWLACILAWRESIIRFEKKKSLMNNLISLSECIQISTTTKIDIRWCMLGAVLERIGMSQQHPIWAGQKRNNNNIKFIFHCMPLNSAVMTNTYYVLLLCQLFCLLDQPCSLDLSASSVSYSLWTDIR